MEQGTGWLNATLVYLAAAVLAVPLARLAGLGSIIGYLAAGIAIGPYGLALVTDAQTMLHVAEFGVVLMLFLVGLELEPRRLWSLRRPIFGWGTVQMAGSALLIGGVALALGTGWRLALVAGLALALSSTAIGLAVLAERNLTATGGGQGVLSVALLQDIAAIPVLALLPLAAAGAAMQPSGGSAWSGALAAAAVVLGIVFGGRLLLRPALRWIAGSRTPEIFTAASLLLVVATAALMHSVGLSMALGAFLAGVLLAESEYRHELETDLEPFKGLLLGLFFIAVGMGIDFAVVLAHPWVVAGVVAGFLAVKALVLGVMARLMPVPLAERPVFVILLAQGGEFGFVVLQTAQGARVVDGDAASLLVAAIALSMLLTPLLLVAADRFWTAHLARHRGAGAPAEIAELQDAPIIIAGFGRYGQTIGRLLEANGMTATVLEHNAEHIESLRRFGWKAFYGDATRLDLLRMAGAAEARIFVLAIDDVEQSVQCATLVRDHFPNCTIVARARNAAHYARLRRLGLVYVERETLDSSLMSGRTVLELAGMRAHEARTQAMKFRRHSIELLEEMVPHFTDEGRIIAIARQGRQQLEQTWAREREQRRQRSGGPWQAAEGE
ncbi:MAG: glutathione-regulated potassium-efflux system protein KefC [Rubrivivax sp.]|nr:glutathione-regulated potassium-efflux system protein KefC [Rubrivivax sp.]